MNTTVADVESEILERAMTADNESWTPEAARAILALRRLDGNLLFVVLLAGAALADRRNFLD